MFKQLMTIAGLVTAAPLMAQGAAAQADQTPLSLLAADGQGYNLEAGQAMEAAFDAADAAFRASVSAAPQGTTPAQLPPALQRLARPIDYFGAILTGVGAKGDSSLMIFRDAPAVVRRAVTAAGLTSAGSNLSLQVDDGQCVISVSRDAAIRAIGASQMFCTWPADDAPAAVPAGQ